MNDSENCELKKNLLNIISSEHRKLNQNGKD